MKEVEWHAKMNSHNVLNDLRNWYVFHTKMNEGGTVTVLMSIYYNFHILKVLKETDIKWKRSHYKTTGSLTV